MNHHEIQEIQELHVKCEDLDEKIDAVIGDQIELRSEVIEVKGKVSWIKGAMWVIIPLLMAVLGAVILVIRNGMH